MLSGFYGLDSLASQWRIRYLCLGESRFNEHENHWEAVCLLLCFAIAYFFSVLQCQHWEQKNPNYCPWKNITDKIISVKLSFIRAFEHQDHYCCFKETKYVNAHMLFFLLGTLSSLLCSEDLNLSLERIPTHSSSPCVLACDWPHPQALGVN